MFKYVICSSSMQTLSFDHLLDVLICTSIFQCSTPICFVVFFYIRRQALQSSLKTQQKLSGISLEQALWKLSKTLQKHSESRISKSSLKIIWTPGSPIALQKFSKNSPKALQKLFKSSLKTPWKQALQKLSESSPKVLQKQADFCWKPSKSRMTFVESSMKAFQKAHKSWQY